MAGEVETSVAQVGLRDFLFYVMPGVTLLAGILAAAGVEPSSLQPYLGISSSLAAVMGSYILGQCAYPGGYLVRILMERSGLFRGLPGEDGERFRAVYRAVARENPIYFAVEVFRYRTMARFCSVMILPILLATAGVASRLDRALPVFSFIIVALLICLGFLWRYYLYECRYRRSLLEVAARSTGLSPAEAHGGPGQDAAAPGHDVGVGGFA